MVDNDHKPEGIDDMDDHDSEVPPIQYDITSYGADYTVDGLVKRLKNQDIFVPHFQREYVWNQAEASRLVESLLLGLPVPGVFLAREADNRLLIIDGQQRLKSLQYFYEGYFNPKESTKTKRIFRLIKVQKQFEGLTYDKLNDSDRIRLDDSIIHATIIKQESPVEDNTSIYHVFERLNTGGKKLAPQEIRTAIYHGRLNALVGDLNMMPQWRDLFGPESPRLKDQELILRFLAAYYEGDEYTKPMNEFLNRFNIKNRNPSTEFLNDAGERFSSAVNFIHQHLGKNVFRPERGLNVAAFEAITVGVARLLDRTSAQIDTVKLKKTIQQLFTENDFIRTITSGTSDESVFKERHRLVKRAFSNI